MVPFPERRALRIVIPGGSGLLGRVLARHFQERGHHVRVLTRGPYTAPWQTVHWDGRHTGPWVDYLEGTDACINLAGRSVNCRWDAVHREEIRASRLETTQLLHRAMAGLEFPPRVWLNASTATIYRHALDRPGIDREMDEATGELGGREWMGKRRRAPESWDFAAGVAKEWEEAFYAERLPWTRKVSMRMGMVMSAEGGGAFAALSNLVRLSLGGKQGNGRQYVSWIHEKDLARAVEFLIEREDLEGAVNVTAPYPVHNRELMAALRDAWEVPNGFPIPGPLVKLGVRMMRTEAELVLKSRRVVPGRLLEAGFQFEFPEWAEAAEDLVRRWRNRE